MSWLYYGLFLDNDTRNRLFDFVNDEHFGNILKKADKIYLDHCTLLHISQYQRGDEYALNTLLLSEPKYSIKMYITHIGLSDKAMAFKVRGIEKLCANKIPHITICTMNNGKPVDSNNIKTWFKLDKEIEIIGILKRI